jgi:hypothetical protein
VLRHGTPALVATLTFVLFATRSVSNLSVGWTGCDLVQVSALVILEQISIPKIPVRVNRGTGSVWER